MRDGEEITPQLTRSSARNGSLVSRLPSVANGVVHLRAGEVAAGVRLVGADAAAGEVAGDGYVVYRGALDGAHVLHRPGDASEEDFVVLAHEPARAEITYEVTLGSHVAGVRLVANTIELLDDKGVPRLRMAPPYLVDGAGRVQFLTVAIEGCNVDRSASPPWERPLVASQSNACRVHIGWDPRSLKYPVVVDPSWTTTTSMIQPRAMHTSTLLNNGRVLVTGGTLDPSTASVVYNTAELFDPALGVWTPTGAMVSQRYTHTATLLSSGRVLVVGGWNQLDANASAELYDPSTGVWLRAGTPGTARAQHTATLLNDQTVLVASGGKVDVLTSTSTALVSCERYFEATNSWAPTGSLASARLSYTANLLSGGSVLVAGGYDATSTSLGSAELYDPTTATWSTTATMGTSRAFHASAALPSGKVLVMGGSTGSMALTGAEIFDPTPPGSWAATASMATSRGAFTATRLPGTNNVLVVGGATGAASFPVTATATAELYNPTTATWTTTLSMNVARSDYTATLIGGGVLVAGGLPRALASSNTAIADAEIYLP